MLHSHNHDIYIQLYTYTCGNIINNNDEQTHFFRKIYLSHFIRKGCERVMCERWVGDWTDCNILIPTSSVFSSTSFSFCSAAQPGILGAGSHYSVLLQLTEPVCGTGLYNCWTPTCFLWASRLHPIQPVQSQVYTLISSNGYTGASLIWQLGRGSICYTYTETVSLYEDH